MKKIKRTFKYSATHKADEEYMRKMCLEGWGAVRLVEGFWTFVQCKPGEYFYRICYLRGKSKKEIEELKMQYKSQDIDFISQYSFWAILRSTKDFAIYTVEEEKDICKQIYSPMPKGAIISWLLFIIGLFISYRLSPYILIPTLIIGLYGSICTYLAIAYHKLIKSV